MKNIFKRFLTLFLVALLLVSLVACGSNEGTTETSSTPAGTSDETSKEENPDLGYLDENGMYVPKVGVLDEYVGETFDILVVGVGGGTYQSDDFTTESGGNGGIDYGDAFYGEVGARNDKIEEVYGITLEVWKEDGAADKAKTDATSGTATYDAVILPVGNLAALAQDNLLWDLNSPEFEGYLDTEAPWWAESASKAYSIDGKLYFMTGDITIMNKVNTWSMLFNKEMIVDYGLDNPYDLFDAGTWTFDKMCEMAKAVSTASPTVAWDDETVTWGMVTATGDAYQFFGGSGLTVCQKDNNDLPILTFGTEASITLAEKVLTVMTTSDWMLYATDATGGPTGNVWTDSFNVFNNGRALFRPSGFSAVTKASSWANIEFGIMPMPKMDANQEGYYTVTSGSWAAAILKNNGDHQFAAYMLDAFAAGAKNYVTPAYIEVNLKRKSLRDSESERILEYIFDSIVYDVGAVYDFGGISSMFAKLVGEGNADIVSSFESVETQALDAIEDVIDAYAQDNE